MSQEKVEIKLRVAGIIYHFQPASLLIAALVLSTAAVLVLVRVSLNEEPPRNGVR